MDAVPTLEEIQKAISLLSTGKAPGGDSIPDLKDASINHLYKRKGNRQACDNHRGISLLSIAGKTPVPLNRLIKHLEDCLLPESQCGFRKNRGTMDMVFATRQLKEKYQEQNSDLYSIYVDLTKVFDTEKTSTSEAKSDTINDFLFADDAALNATSEVNIQHSVDKFSNACDNFGLTISTKKIEVMNQPAPGKPYVEPNITINNQRLNVVDKFTYLDSTLSSNIVIDDEVNARLTKASVAFSRLFKNVRDRRGITTEI
ncbi:uncharacterized protein LOC134270061 [Saccostrea cucullata]|uniref:uncharacterized protein LOC134270061 n=1 Tax=Saccostrea cuccullata TaxID=36930 RepID=UPI002ED2ED0C